MPEAWNGEIITPSRPIILSRRLTEICPSYDTKYPGVECDMPILSDGFALLLGLPSEGVKIIGGYIADGWRAT